MKLTTTLARIREHSPCTSGWKTLLQHLGGIDAYGEDTPINLLTILDSNCVQDMLWCLRATVEDSKSVASQLAIAFAEDALSMFEARFPNDDRPRKAIKAAKDFIDGKIDHAAYAAYAADAAYAAADAAREKAIRRQADIIRGILQ